MNCSPRPKFEQFSLTYKNPPDSTSGGFLFIAAKGRIYPVFLQISHSFSDVIISKINYVKLAYQGARGTVRALCACGTARAHAHSTTRA